MDNEQRFIPSAVGESVGRVSGGGVYLRVYEWYTAVDYSAASIGTDEGRGDNDSIFVRGHNA